MLDGMETASVHRMTVEQYLELEKTAEVKHEFHDGLLVAMVGVTQVHALVTLNVGAWLRANLRGGPCRVVVSDFKVHVAAANRFFYPDVTVYCDASSSPDSLFTAVPKVIVEVLSPSTANYDRGKKFADYRRLDSLEAYVLVDTDWQAVDVFRPTADRIWYITSFGPGEQVPLQSLGLDIPVDAIYEDSDVPVAG